MDENSRGKWAGKESKRRELEPDTELLCEIGIATGRSLAEVRELDFAEIQIWASYVRKYGSLNVGRRVEQELARIHHSFIASKGVKDVKLVDLMTHEAANYVATNDDDYLSDSDEDALYAYMMNATEEPSNA